MTQSPIWTLATGASVGFALAIAWGGSGCARSMCEGAAPAGNPAALYCGDLGGTLEDGDPAQCVFPDGTACGQWAFFEGECGLDQTACAQAGLTTSTGYCNAAAADHVVCETGDGSTCFDWDLALGTCAP